MGQLKSSRRAFLGVTLASPLFASCMTARKRSITPKNITELLLKIREKNGLPAIVAGAVKDGALVALGAVGVRKVGHLTPVTASDKFHIGSCTKAMTATLAAILVEQGKLQWNSALAEIFPERTAKIHHDYRDVTLEMLLTHRSGAPPNGAFSLLVPDLIARRLLHGDYHPSENLLTAQRLAFLDATLANPPEKQPGTAFEYSNAGYMIVGAILERVSGILWEQLIRQRLFKPLRMGSAGFGPPSRPDTPDQPWGHILKDGEFEPFYGDNPPALGPAGTVHCSVADYLKFADFHASMGERPKGLLQRPSLEKLHQPTPNSDYACGWVVYERKWAQGMALMHNGSNTMNYFVSWLAPKINFATAIASNAAGDNIPQTLDDVAGELVRQFAG